MSLPSTIMVVAALSVVANAQSQVDSGLDSGDASATAVNPSNPPLSLTYPGPTEKTKLDNYLSAAFAPYPILAIAGIATTTRYALAEAFKEDMLYYRCTCKGMLPRLNHAVISSFTAPRLDNGHAVFFFPAVIAPYVATMTAVYGGYPGRYDATDAFRLGNYGLLGYVGWNIAMNKGQTISNPSSNS